MKKKVIFMGLGLLIPWMGGILMLFLVLLMNQGAEPIPTVATEEEAAEYQYVGSELGVPWDIVMLTDILDADEKKKKDLKDYNPLVTSLEFCRLTEEKYKWVYDEETDTGDWVEAGKTEYAACDEILSYLQVDRERLDYRDVGKLIRALQKTAEEKSNNQERYEVVLVSNPDYEMVLTTYIGMSERHRKAVMDLYESKYLLYLYGYLQSDVGEVELPELTVGNVRREELLRVAASLINWPYMMGGKSSAVGSPSGPLDCSGYVDWVYIQCFGKGISAGGKIPSGVAVAGTAIQFYASREISESELQIGDLGFLEDPAKLASGKVNHVGIYVGEIGGQHAFIHCGGKYYGNADRPNGRVGVSVERGENTQIPGLSTFEPPMKSCKFHYFRRPNFQFIDDAP